MSPTIAARSQNEARRQYTVPVQRAIAAFAENVFLIRSGFAPAVDALVLRLAGRGVMDLRDGEGEPRLNLFTELYYRIVQAADAPRYWTVHTAAYIYRVHEAAGPRRPVVAYHWHPHVEGIPFPHIHALAGPADLQRLHFATPHATLAHALTFAMRDYGVRPIRDDWDRALADADEALQASMQWAARPSLRAR